MTAMVRPPSSSARTAKALRPYDAASLLLVDRSGSKPRILMGRRHASLVFMPGKFVFPGGRADPIDGAIAATAELNENDVAKLLAGMGSRASLRRARALGLCAVRETFEETGLRIGQTTSGPIALPMHRDWSAFLDNGMMPALDSLRYFARAVTPPDNVRRFDTRFFIVFRDQVPELDGQSLVPSGELEDLDWVSIDQIDKLDVAHITQAILKEARVLLSNTKPELPPTLPVVQYSKRHGRFVREVI
ncbi:MULTISPECIES: NUDIX hydrolase [Brucella/Ochrobactrum group]|uniref:NUDIX hydrolase n=1 Tax=Brucella/Ochrobactrum group TaxID=2826938 RepID=UPI00111EF36E|nr:MULTISPECIES: NUDIX hydrolase [Brucella/Ochrobactrum group]